MSIPLKASIRQFARAIAADQFAGDELAMAIAGDEEVTDQDAPSERAGVFREFVVNWRKILEADAPPQPFSSATLVRGLGPLPSEERLVLLMHDICGLMRSEIEYVLQPLSKPFDELLQAERSLIKAGRAGRKALIVEDEPLIAADLKELLEQMHVDVVALARTAEQGAREAIDRTPDIVLADYNLDGRQTGVDAVAGFQDRHRCPVIFITGYPDQVLKGDAIEPDFVIVKPYRAEAVQAAVAHCLDTARFDTIEADETPVKS